MTSGDAIRPLPPEVVAQLKSATAIVSLRGVVLELLANALDAGATTVEAAVDFGRGGCTVEDDGLGIAPLEFREDGGLGKLYWTSKFFSSVPCLGRQGTFLASLAAVSLLTITSHHHQHGSHSSVTFHHAHAVERLLPAPPARAVRFERHGTRVTVRNLFGNLPVRVKQRAVLVEQKPEQDRLWEALKRDVTALVLSCQRPVALRLRDAAHRTVLNFTGPPPPSHANSRPKELQFTLDTLSQAGYISAGEWPSWVPAAASTSAISIKGAISKEPAPTKRLQFIELGIRPLSSDAGHNELYDQVNRLFALSSFGTVEDDATPDGGEKLRRENDGRFKSDGYTHSQLKGRKGVDRYPMFRLRISLKDGKRQAEGEDWLLDQETNLQAVIEVLQALVFQWLSVHHFRPRQPRQRHAQHAAAKPSTVAAQENQSIAPLRTASPLTSGSRISTPLRSTSLSTGSRKRKALGGETERNPAPRRQSTFHEWSRIKSGKSDFYHNLWAPGAQEDHPRTPTSPATPSHTVPSSQGIATFDMEPIFPGSLNTPVSALHCPGETLLPESNEQDLDGSDHDEIMTWVDPTTKQSYLLNARTGCVIPDNASRPHSAPGAVTNPQHAQRFGRTMRLPKRVKTADEPSNVWLNGLLRTWNNPVFKPTEKQIQQVAMLDDGNARDRNRSSNFHCSHTALDRALENDSLTSAVAKLSKKALCNARVIAQLDTKFILVKMAANPTQEEGALVLIDQHAADERVRVEALLTELCTPLPHTSNQYRSALGHTPQVAYTVLETPLYYSVSAHERELFTTHAGRFAAWGIIYDVCIPPVASNKDSTACPDQGRQLLSVTCLPPSIFERCKADPKLLITFLRSTLWTFSEAQVLPPTSDSRQSEDDSNESPLWLKRLSSCPSGLVDLVNSRACRSAIMFNDELSIPVCEELVAKLSACVFPFMCAHGRPSMVPLLNLGEETSGNDFSLRGSSAEAESAGIGKDFVDAWKRWKRS